MQCCWKKKNRYLMIALAVGLWLLAAAFLASLLIERIVSYDGSLFIYAPLSLLGYYGLFRLAFMVVIDQREFCFSEQGLTISYFGLWKTQYSWDDFSEIAICKLRYSQRFRWIHKVGIRFAVGYEPNGPQFAKEADEPWSTDAYEFRHWRTIITIEFSEERLAELRRFCPREVRDYRNLKDPVV